MDTEKISKLAVEMLLELSKEDDPENALLLRMAEQRLKTLLVYAINKKHDQACDQRDSAISNLY